MAEANIFQLFFEHITVFLKIDFIWIISYMESDNDQIGPKLLVPVHLTFGPSLWGNIYADHQSQSGMEMVSRSIPILTFIHLSLISLLNLWPEHVSYTGQYEKMKRRRGKKVE